MDEAFTGLSGYWRVVDDVVISDSEEDRHVAPVQFRWIPVVPGYTCRYTNITAITDTLTQFSTPVNCTDLHHFCVSQPTCLKY